VEAVLDRLKAHGYLDDRRYAEAFAGARVENKGFGRARVLRDLRERRVAPAVAREAVESAFDGRNEIELIEAFLARKYRNVPLAEYLSDPRRLASAYGRLRRAGFGASSSIRVLRRYAKSADALEEIGEPPEEPGAGV
jgi:regulatory protein